MSREIHDTDPKAYRYIPAGKTIQSAPQSVLPFNLMEKVIEDARGIALGHCPCRVGFALVGGGCDHPTEVCMKFNDMASFFIDKGFAREITKTEALEVIKLAEEHGLVHFVDNTEGEIQHNCNCCGCACWNVGAIRRRSTPRNAIMATYFIRETDIDKCIGCGACADICPVDAVNMSADDVSETDTDWCIGCGVCVTACHTDAIAMVYRKDKTQGLPAQTFGDLHELISMYRKKKIKPATIGLNLKKSVRDG
ncbi:4Fe-4S binding protein [Desulfobacula phenolica]|uniref:4Fe-4S dicluster domain-containing protein n=1 Tax=Desulfobacula phenolica TaxID=90732 RepID=A0A1H2J444_9BACT|nr:4Fe-4S binding protein [Desulfobacula phenolica]SDU50925.1 4Fe-4S dicluster domain-containing protein [Desulfobacula phenolica]